MFKVRINVFDVRDGKIVASLLVKSMDVSELKERKLSTCDDFYKLNNIICIVKKINFNSFSPKIR